MGQEKIIEDRGANYDKTLQNLDSNIHFSYNSLLEVGKKCLKMTFPSGLPCSPPITLATCEHLTRESEAARPVSSAQARLPPLKVVSLLQQSKQGCKDEHCNHCARSSCNLVHAFTAHHHHHQHENSDRLSPGPGFNLRHTGPEIRRNGDSHVRNRARVIKSQNKTRVCILHHTKIFQLVWITRRRKQTKDKGCWTPQV